MTEASSPAVAPPAGLPLLATKLFVPRPRADLVARPRLLARLHRGLTTAACTVLSAPAGAGKSSLLAAWAAELDRPSPGSRSTRATRTCERSPVAGLGGSRHDHQRPRTAIVRRGHRQRDALGHAR